jgi:hypothetical protein
VEHQRRIERADPVEGHAVPAEDHCKGGEHALRQVLRVLGGKGQLVDASSNAESVEQRVLGLPRATHGLADAADG